MSATNQDLVHSLLINLQQEQEAEGATGDGPPGDVDDEEGFEYDEELYEQLLGMGFDEEDVLQALKVAPFDKSAALDYLVLNVAEPSLPKQIAPVVATKDKVRLEFIATGSSPSQEQAIIRLSQAGFGRADCLAALNATGNETLALYHLFDSLVSEEAKAQARAAMEEKQGTGELLIYTPDELKEHRDEELMVLESIFAEDFTKKSDTLLTIKLPSIETLTGDTMLEVHIPDSSPYPLQPPYLICSNPKLSAQGLLEVHRKLAAEAWAQIGQGMLYNIVMWLQEQVPVILAPLRAAEEQEEKKRQEKARKDKEKEDAAHKAAYPQSSGPLSAIDRTMQRIEEEKLKAQKAEEERAARAALLKRLLAEDEERERNLANGVVPEAAAKPKETPAAAAAAEEAKKKEEEEAKPVKIKVIPPRYQKQQRRGGTKAYADMSEAERQRDRERKEQYGQQLMAAMQAKQRGDAKYQAMQEVRVKLPAYKMKEEILGAVASNQVVVISGETGCGKTTQVPQLILDEEVGSGRGGFCNIICTQPRRISAIAVAERVADERAEPIGRAVGWQIRLESKKSADTRLMFCTTGLLLRRLQTDKMLDDVSHIVVDEVHERDINSDFLLIILRDLLAVRPDLKLVLMSATLNADLFSRYFGNAPTIEIPGFTHPVTEHYLEDIIEMTQYVLDPTSPYAKRDKNGGRDKKAKGGRAGKKGNFGGGGSAGGMIRGKPTEQKKKDFSDMVDELYPHLSRTTRNSLEVVNEEEINYELIEELIMKIGRDYEEGGILVFLPGLMEITTLYEQLLSNREMKDKKRYLVLPLHSTLSTEQQQAIFSRPPKGVRKIVIATNIAETSITIDDIVFVIDSGRVKERRYDSAAKMSALVEIWISRANKRQRRGRAGRVKPGHSFHLFTRWREQSKLRDFPVPEILRVPLDEMALQIRLLELGKSREFLSKAIEPPSDAAIKTAINNLRDLHALDDDEDLTPLGYHLATLPVDPRIGKMMIFGSVFRCLEPVLTIAASMSFRSPFVSPIDKRDEADRSKRLFAQNLFSDHLALWVAFKGYEEARREGRDRQFCHAKFLSQSTLRMIADLKSQFFTLLVDIGFVDKDKGKRSTEKSPEYNTNSDNLRLVKAIICAGLYPNIIRVENPSASLAAAASKNGKNDRNKATLKFYTKKNEEVAIHPSSTLFGLPALPSEQEKWLIYHEKVKTTKVYIRDGTFVAPYPLLLFGGQIDVHHEKQMIELDKWILFRANAKVGVLMQKLRRELDKLLLLKIENPHVDVTDAGQSVIDTIVTLIATEGQQETADLSPVSPALLSLTSPPASRST